MELNKNWFRKKISNFLIEDSSNKMLNDGSLIFESDGPIGFVSGNDNIFEDYKKIIGNFHMTPKEAFIKYCEKNGKSIPKNLNIISVVAFILPINKDTKIQNLTFSDKMPSERWAHTRLFGEQANQKLQDYLVKELQKEGVDAVAPANQSYMFKMFQKHENGVWASTWSHRHMAFASGLGSFGLSDGFINEKGIAMRMGSIIVNYSLSSDAEKRPKNPYHYCSNCGECIKRCPVGAISFEKGHDKQKCSEHVYSTTRFIKSNFGINIYACGLCQVGVPCENGFPIKKSNKKK